MGAIAFSRRLLASPLCGYAFQYEPSVRRMSCILVYCASTAVYSREESTFLPPLHSFPVVINLTVEPQKRKEIVCQDWI